MIRQHENGVCKVELFCSCYIVEGVKSNMWVCLTLICASSSIVCNLSIYASKIAPLVHVENVYAHVCKRIFEFTQERSVRASERKVNKGTKS